MPNVSTFTRAGRAVRRLAALAKSLEELRLYPLAGLFGDTGARHAPSAGTGSPASPADVFAACRRLADCLPAGGDPVLSLVTYRLLTAENTFSAAADRGETPDPLCIALVRRELAILERLVRPGARRLFRLHARAHGLPALDWDAAGPAAPAPRPLPGFDTLRALLAGPGPWPDFVDDLAALHRAHGSGDALRHLAWEVVDDGAGEWRIVPVEHLELPEDDAFFRYEDQRLAVRRNTEAFLRGLPAQDLLLFGDRGTGKSSTIRLMLTEYAARGLRLVRVPSDLGAIRFACDWIRDRRWRFVLFIDDISFDAGTAVNEFRSLLEGDLNERPANAVFYVTSNRRHILRGTQRHTTSGDDPLNEREDEQELLALSDRFGVKVWFPTPSQAEYLDIVRGLAARRGLAVEPADLERRALVWERWHNQRSPRTAWQFVDALTAELAGS